MYPGEDLHIRARHWSERNARVSYTDGEAIDTPRPICNALIGYSLVVPTDDEGFENRFELKLSAAGMRYYEHIIQNPYYKQTLTAVRRIIRNHATAAIAPLVAAKEEYRRHEPDILRICHTIEHLDRTDMQHALEAARLVGYILCAMESRMYWDHAQTHALVATDQGEGNDVPIALPSD
jgi:hypothetical protein